MVSLILTIILCGVLLFIAIEDFRFLGVRWPAFPLLFIVTIIFSLFQVKTISEILTYTSINLLIGLAQYLGLITFSYLKDRNTNILNSKIGLGDFLFLFGIAPLLHPLLFVLFLITSLCLTLIIIFIRKTTDKHVPLAGYLALFLIFGLIIATLLNFNL